MSDRRLDRLLLAALLAIALLRGLLWICVYPALKIADETSHFDNIQYRAEHGLRRAMRGPGPIDKVLGYGAAMELRRTWTATNHYWRGSFLRAKRSVPEEKELSERALVHQDAISDGQDSAMGYPGVYYTLGVIPYKIFRRSSVLTRLFAVRTMSLLFGLILVACTFYAARWTLDSRPLAFAAGLFATLQPMAAQQTIAINNDAGLIGLCAIVFLLQLRILRELPHTPPLWLVGLLGATSACAIETKPHAYAMLPGSLILAGLIVIGAPRARRGWIAVAVGIGAYVALRLLLPQLIDRSAPAAMAGAVVTPTHEIATASPGGFLSFLTSVDPGYQAFLFVSSWGAFCWLDLGLPGAAFDNLHLLAPLFWLGAGAAAARRLLAPEQRFFWNARLAAFSAFTAVTACGFVLYAEYVTETLAQQTNVVQGRALLFALPAFAIVGAIAVGSLVPRRLRTLMAALCIACMVLLAATTVVVITGYEYAG